MMLLENATHNSLLPTQNEVNFDVRLGYHSDVIFRILNDVRHVCIQRVVILVLL